MSGRPIGRLDAATGLRIMCGASGCEHQLGNFWRRPEPRENLITMKDERRCPTHGTNQILADRLQADWDGRRSVPGLGIRPAAGFDRARAFDAARRLAEDPSDLGPVDEERTRRLESQRAEHLEKG